MLDNITESGLYLSQQRLKITGDIFLVQKFAGQFVVGKRPFKNQEKEKYSDDDSKFLSEEEKKEAADEIRVKTFRRAKKRLTDLINTNVFEYLDCYLHSYMPVFLTLTFHENLQDIEVANYEFTKFIRRLNWLAHETKKSFLRYVVVIEFQERGAVHYHVIFFNLPFIPKDKLREVWGNGHIKIKAVDDIRNMGYYVTKYMSKNFDDERLKGHKCYFASKGLLKPTIVCIEELIESVKKLLPEASKEDEKHDIPIPHLAYMDYWRYNLRNYPEEKKEILDFLKHYS